MKELVYEKQIIGYLIKYYRKKLKMNISDLLFDNNTKYYNDFCIDCDECNNKSQICVKTTLYKLERGENITNECIYHRLAQKIGKRVILDRQDIYEHLEMYCNELNTCLINYSISKMKSLEAEISIELLNYKNVLYIEEILSLLLDIIQNFIYKTPSTKNKLDIYLYLKDKLNQNHKKLVTFYLYNDGFKYREEGFTIDVINDECKDYFNDPLFYEAKLYSIGEMNSLDAYKYLLDNEYPKFNELTNYHKYLLLNGIAYIQLNASSYEKCYQTYLEMIDIINTNKMDTDFIKMTYHKLGRLCYLMEKYDDTIDWIEKAIKLDINKTFTKDILFLFSSYEKTNNQYKIMEIINSISMEKIKNEYTRKIIVYYKSKYTNENSNKNIELEDMIVSLKPYFNIYGTLHKSVFDEDLKKSIEITGNYKKYYIFNS